MFVFGSVYDSVWEMVCLNICKGEGVSGWVNVSTCVLWLRLCVCVSVYGCVCESEGAKLCRCVHVSECECVNVCQCMCLSVSV